MYAVDNVDNYSGRPLKGLCKVKKFQKSEFTMEVGGWVQVSLEFFCVENCPKIALNQGPRL